MQVEIVEKFATQIVVDVLAVKYAQARYGLDLVVYDRLLQAGYSGEAMSPLPGQYELMSAPEGFSARYVLFVGTDPLSSLNYLEIRGLARNILSALAKALPHANTLALTLHGANYGLDETECFEAMLAGFADAMQNGDVPKHLNSIRFAEMNAGRASRLRRALHQVLPTGSLELNAQGGSTEPARERLRSVGYASKAKSHVFVAMPFSEDFDDIYHYGIQSAVNASGLLCERADLSTFTGDVLSWIRERIRTASLLVADLSTANPNVYLEVGYAWGCDVPIVLLTRDAASLKFDVHGQRCLTYKRIKDLEGKLASELTTLSSKPRIP